jgi:hypothetical protein
MRMSLLIGARGMTGRTTLGAQRAAARAQTRMLPIQLLLCALDARDFSWSVETAAETPPEQGMY